MRGPIALASLLLIATALLAAACGDEAEAVRGPDGDSPTPSSEVQRPVIVLPADGDVADDAGSVADGVSDPSPEPPDSVSPREKAAAMHREMNRVGRALLASFESRVYSPVRNDGVTFSEGHVEVRTAGVEARYAFTFDASLPPDRRTVVTRVDGERADRPNLPNGTARQVFEFLQVSLNGPYRFVVNYLPPIPVLFTPGTDGTGRVVTALPHKRPVQVSYRLDERDLVAIRGTSVKPQKEIAHFAWDDWRGRHLLTETTFAGSDAVAAYEYDGLGGVVLMQRATIRKKGAGFDAAFTYDRLDRGDPEDPLIPNLPKKTDAPERDGQTPPKDDDTPK